MKGLVRLWLVLSCRKVLSWLPTWLPGMTDPYVLLLPVRSDDGQVVDFIYAFANDAACAANGMDRDQLIGASLLSLLPGHADSGFLSSYAAVVDTGVPYVLDGQRYFNERLGVERFSDVRGVKVGPGLALTWRDATDRLEALAELKASEAKYRLLVEHISDVVVHIRNGHFAWVSESSASVLGFDPEFLTGRQVGSLTHPDDLARVLAGLESLAGGGTATERFRIQDAFGQYHWVQASGGPLYQEDGQMDGFVVSLRVIDEQVQALVELELRARTDALTGLANRSEAFLRLSRELELCPRTGDRVGVIFCDFDDFKAVNDSFGHAGGDELLRQVASRMQAAVRSSDVVARIGGDEILVLVPGVHDLADALAVAHKVQQAVSDEVLLPSGRMIPRMSFGVTVSAHSESADALVDRADRALYMSKASGKSQVTGLPVPPA